MQSGSVSPYILVVDAHGASFEAIRHLVRSSSFRLVRISSTEAVAGVLRGLTFDGLIVDGSVSPDGGVAFVSSLRADYPDLPVVVTGSTAPEKLAGNAARCGAHGYLAQPYEASEILDVMVAAFVAESA